MSINYLGAHLKRDSDAVRQQLPDQTTLEAKTLLLGLDLARAVILDPTTGRALGA